MISVYEEVNKKKDLDYEEIINTISESIQNSYDVTINYENLNSEEDKIELSLTIMQNSCGLKYKLFCIYDNLNEDEINYDIYINFISCKEELRNSDILELSNLLKSVEEIMNV